MKLSAEDFQTIRRWVYRNARPLDLARWQYHFENGPQENVVAALSAYQNDDGGFGNALEPDNWNPNASPYSTLVAINLLGEVKFRDRSHPMMQGILRYLEITPDFDGERWLARIDSNDDYPHAPWWADRGYDWGYTPTAMLAGCILVVAGPETPLYQTAKKIAQKAVHTYLYGIMPDGTPYNCVRREGEIQGLTMMLEFLEAAQIGQEFPIAEMRKVLKQQAESFFEKDETKWGQYCWKPSLFIKSPDSPFYPGSEAAIETELTYILKERSVEGIWEINWSWGAYEEAFAVSKNWWKAAIIIDHLLMLRNFGRL